MSKTAVQTTTTKTEFRALIIAAMEEMRSLGNEASWQSLCRFVEKSGVLREGDFKLNDTADTHPGFEHLWHTNLSYAASDMKREGLLFREHGAPWMPTSWGITTEQFVREIHEKTKPQLTACGECFTLHTPNQKECW